MSPAPSVNAEAELLKNAYRFTLPTLGFNVQVVVAVIDVLPGLLALPELSVKFTALLESVTVTDWLSTAFSVIGCAAEFSTCALNVAAKGATKSPHILITRTNFDRKPMAKFL